MSSKNKNSKDLEIYINEEYKQLEQDEEERDIDVFSPETLKEIEECKKKNAQAFQSYWEMDENDVEGWSQEQIKQDPSKQLISMAESGYLSEIKLLFDERSAPEIERMLMSKDSDGYTALHRACYSNCVDVIRYLTSFENNPAMPNLNQLNARTDMGWTPLHSAVYWNNFMSVEYLLKYANADANMQTNSGQTCLHLTAQNSNAKETLILLLLNPFAKFNLRNDQGELAIQIAERSCKYHRLYEITQDHLNKL